MNLMSSFLDIHKRMYIYICILLDNYIKLMYIHIYIKNDTVMFTR